ncbi:hypothetical protein OPV22_033972 [Ensete ventricosum]|uniref:Uncharacterized protein n=1 Tax=Ensete ventricosum TaxID=4639 RepID=A0AAV8P3U6_ENSVE|nr:hypothetical protein OPV22_033972 [Ensete ventricosum]
MERPTSDMSSANAVLLGALASGVNDQTWFVLKVTFLLLGLCLTSMLALAFSSSDFTIVGHVLLLVTIGAVLFLLLNRFLAQTDILFNLTHAELIMAKTHHAPANMRSEKGMAYIFLEKS